MLLMLMNCCRCVRYDCSQEGAVVGRTGEKNGLWRGRMTTVLEEEVVKLP